MYAHFTTETRSELLADDFDHNINPSVWDHKNSEYWTELAAKGLSVLRECVIPGKARDNSAVAASLRGGRRQQRYKGWDKIIPTEEIVGGTKCLVQPVQVLCAFIIKIKKLAFLLPGPSLLLNITDLPAGLFVLHLTLMTSCVLQKLCGNLNGMHNAFRWDCLSRHWTGSRWTVLQTWTVEVRAHATAVPRASVHLIHLCPWAYGGKTLPYHS